MRNNFGRMKSALCTVGLVGLLSISGCSQDTNQPSRSYSAPQTQKQSYEDNTGGITISPSGKVGIEIAPGLQYNLDGSGIGFGF